MGSQSRSRQAGFALVEVMVTMVILAVGVLGVVGFADGASEATGGNKAREAATSLGREVLEVARAAPYGSLAPDGLATHLQSRSRLADSSPAPGYTIVRRNVTYTLTLGACAVDDAKDGVGNREGAVPFCSDSPPPGTTDQVPDDYRRVSVTLEWVQGTDVRSTRQTGVITNPAGGLGPSVTTLALRTMSSPVTANVSPATFDLTTSSTPASVSWSVNGDRKGSASGADQSWSFDWAISGYRDGAYIVQAQAFDAAGRSGVARKTTVVLNRFAPDAPTGFAGGRNGTQGHVDLEWHANPEGDVVGYRVYRSDASGTIGERACPAAGAGGDAVVQATSCVDEGAAASGTLHYVAVAVDVSSSGGRREGAATGVLAIGAASAAPTTPGGVSACDGGDAACNGPDGQPAPVGTTVIRWTASGDPDGTVRFYRIYRDGSGYESRYDRLYEGDTLAYVDRTGGGDTHDYRVSAVDAGFAESALSAVVTR